MLADPNRVAQALDNLIANSLRYGDGPVELASVRSAGTMVELHVWIAAPASATSSSPTRSSVSAATSGGGEGPQGAGLGLAIVEAIAHAHGGTVAARNRPGGGADVWLTLPEA